MNIFTSDPKFEQSVRVTFHYLLASVPLKLIAALLVAVVMNRAVKGITFYRTAIYFPSLIGGSIAVSMLWRNIFRVDGIFNKIISVFGLGSKGWITSPDTAMSTFVLLTVRMINDSGSAQEWGQLLAMSLVSIVPATLVFMFLQKYFVEGIATTGIKG